MATDAAAENEADGPAAAATPSAPHEDKERRDTAAAEAEEDDGEAVMGGEREWLFRDGSLLVRSYEDFVAAAIGGVITTASSDLARFAAEAAPHDAWEGLSCLELGSGCGLVSSTLLQLGARVYASEQEQFLEHLEYNLSLNRPQGAVSECLPCDWGSAESRAALRERLGPDGAHAIFAANCVYDREAVEPFLATLSAAMGPKGLAFMCGVPVPPVRHDGESFLDAFLAAAPLQFACYLLDFKAGKPMPESRQREEQRAAEAGRPENLGPAGRIAAEHGLSEGQLADGVWLLWRPGGPPLPQWLPKALVRLELVEAAERQ